MYWIKWPVGPCWYPFPLDKPDITQQIKNTLLLCVVGKACISCSFCTEHKGTQIIRIGYRCGSLIVCVVV